MIAQLVSLEGAIAAVQDVNRGLIWIVEGGQPRLASYNMASGTQYLQPQTGVDRT
jgi:hypothetical protein